MAEPLKNMYNQTFFDDLIAALTQVYPPFERTVFLERVYDDVWENRPLKERMRHVGIVLRGLLPAEYRAALNVLRQAAPLLSQYTFQLIFLPDFVELYGLDDWDASIPALEFFTPFCSSEFAVRPFILKDAPRMMVHMLAWADSENHHVRRLASEGSRPRLPWAMALPMFKRDPALILPILEKLKDDPEEYVRRSVANNLNDIAKDNPQAVIDILSRWNTDASEEVQWVIRRALRTLIKDGHGEALGLLGYGHDAQITVKNIRLSQEQINMGEILAFTFEIEGQADEPQDLMIDYVVYFKKANGTLAPKVFKLTQKQIAPGETLHLEKRHHFKPITTRVYYPGEHRLALKINGQEFDGGQFDLML